MRTIALGLASLLLVSGWGLAAQSSKERETPSSKGESRMMEEMMKNNKEGSHMGGMMRMMKMMDQCASMMDSMHAKAEKREQGQAK